jgi:acyl-CoA thioester hydrolase
MTDDARAFRFVLRVRYADTDQMGMVYYANYLRWFEIGRTEMLRAHGRSYRAIEEAGIRLPVLEASCRYLQPARYDDLVAIETTLAELGRASMRFTYRVVRADDGQLLATGSSAHCFLDAAGRPVRPPADFRALLQRAHAAQAGGSAGP